MAGWPKKFKPAAVKVKVLSCNRPAKYVQVPITVKQKQRSCRLGWNTHGSSVTNEGSGNGLLYETTHDLDDSSMDVGPIFLSDVCSTSQSDVSPYERRRMKERTSWDLVRQKVIAAN